ncbi:MAG: alpha/beta fold hydrolase [Actinomycetota bacterium]
MATFVLIHGAFDSAWYWHLVEPELRDRGRDVVAMDLPGEDDSAGLVEYADTVVDAIGDRRDLVLVAPLPRSSMTFRRILRQRR